MDPYKNGDHISYDSDPCGYGACLLMLCRTYRETEPPDKKRICMVKTKMKQRGSLVKDPGSGLNLIQDTSVPVERTLEDMKLSKRTAMNYILMIGSGDRHREVGHSGRITELLLHVLLPR